MTVFVEPLKLHAGQREIIESTARFRVASCGRRFGKTMMAAWWISATRKHSALAGAKVAWFAPTYKLLMEVYDGIERTLRPVVRRSNRMEQRIDLVTGGTVDFWTLEDRDAGRGRRYHRVVIDEAAHARLLENVWERSIRPTLTDFAGQAMFVSTPCGDNYFKQLWTRARKDQTGEWAAFRKPTSANPHIPPSEIEAARRDLPSLVFSQEYEAEFITWGGGMVKPEMLIEGRAPAELPVILGVDLAISTRQTADYSAIAAISRDPQTGIIYVREVERGRWTFRQTYERIQAAAKRHKPTMVAIEDVQYQSALVQEIARTTDLPVRGIRPDRDKLARFAPLLTRFEQHLVRIDPERVAPYVREELLAFPHVEHDDCVDALSTAWVALRGVESAGRSAIRSSRTFSDQTMEISV